MIAQIIIVAVMCAALACVIGEGFARNVQRERSR